MPGKIIPISRRVFLSSSLLVSTLQAISRCWDFWPRAPDSIYNSRFVSGIRKCQKNLETIRSAFNLIFSVWLFRPQHATIESTPENEVSAKPEPEFSEVFTQLDSWQTEQNCYLHCNFQFVVDIAFRSCTRNKTQNLMQSQRCYKGGVSFSIALFRELLARSGNTCLVFLCVCVCVFLLLSKPELVFPICSATRSCELN